VVTTLSLEKIKEACNTLLSNKKIRFICVVDSLGNSVFEKQQKNTELFIPDKNSRSLFIKSALEIFLQKDFDQYIGLLRYNIGRRDKIDMITIPVFDYVILISVTPKENCDVIATSAINLFEKILKPNND